MMFTFTSHSDVKNIANVPEIIFSPIMSIHACGWVSLTTNSFTKCLMFHE